MADMRFTPLFRKNYYMQVAPAAQYVQMKTNIPAPLVIAWYAWETNFGKNESSRLGNNHAGIKSNSSWGDKAIGQYEAYTSIQDFGKDYARILLLPEEWRGYPEVLRTAQRTNDFTAITKAMNASKWAEHDYKVSDVVAWAIEAQNTLSGNYSPPVEVPAVENVSQTDLAKLGAAFMGAVVLALSIKK